MQKTFARWAEKYLRRNNRRRIWKSVVRAMAYVVVFCTTYSLILPAITLEKQYSCGLEEHAHSQECYTEEIWEQMLCAIDAHSHNDACYDTQGEISCGMDGTLLHVHDRVCYDKQERLICTLQEVVEHGHSDNCYTITGHAHSDDCYVINQGEQVCQLLEESGHSHEAGCYVQTEELTCLQEESEAHAHEDACYKKELVCEEAEREGHAHGTGCFDVERVLICTQEELEETETLTCSLPEIVKNETTAQHQHTEGCVLETVENKLICEQEEHIHDLSCSSDPNADVETAEDWEQTLAEAELAGVWAEDLAAVAGTQIGYRESTKNYLTEDGQSKQGYTRYGAWYGIPYGDWNGMFTSFCLNYAKIPQKAVWWQADVAEWVEQLQMEELLQSEVVPQVGDLLFLKDETDAIARVGIVSGLDMELDPETGDEIISWINTIQGDVDGEVATVKTEPGSREIVGSVKMDALLERYLQQYPKEAAELGLILPEREEVVPGVSDPTQQIEETVPGVTDPTQQTEETVPGVTDLTQQTEETIPEPTDPTQQTEEETIPEYLTLSQSAETENYMVTVTYGADLELPEGTEFRVTEYARDSEIFRQRCEEAGYELDWLLNIGFFLGEEELELDGAFDVVVTSKQGEALGSDITHFAESGAERIDGAEEGDTAVAFSADSFSDFGGGDSSVLTISNEAVTADATSLWISAADDGADNLQKTKVNNIETTDTVTYLSGKFTNGSDSYVRFGSSNTYTIQSGDVATLQLKLSNVPTVATLGKVVFAVQVKDADPNEAKLEIPIVGSDEFVTITMELDSLAGYVFNFVQLKWSGAASSATMSYEIESIRIGQPEHTHSYTYTVSFDSGCGNGGSVTYTCSTCDKTSTETLANTSVLSYANQLRAANTDLITADDKFTWETENYKGHKWTYYNGVMMDAFMKIGTSEMIDFVVAYYDAVLNTEGEPRVYNSGEVDSVPPALALFDLLGTSDATRNQKYVKAIQFVFDELWNKQTVLGSEYGGNFLHKSSWTTYQFGLDGIYMAMPFLMECANALDDGLLEAGSLVDSEGKEVTSDTIYNTINSRLNWVATTMYDETTGLYHHGWDGSNGNGVFWGRGIGWYAVALVDIIDMMPATYQTQLTSNLTKLFDGMLRWQDAETGMWYNVINYDSTLSGNKLETSVSSMMAYSMMKAYREGWVDAKYYEAGLRALNGVVTNKMSDGSVEDTYKSSSVYTTPEEYTTSTYTINEAKGVGALIMAAAPDHSWSAWTTSEVQTAAAEDGVTETRTCSVCGETQTRTVTVAEEERTVIGYTLTVVNPKDLKEGEVYAIYAADGDTTYNFLTASSKNPPNVQVDTTVYQGGGYNANAKQIGESWYVPASYFDHLKDYGNYEMTPYEAFTWTVKTNGDNKWLAMRGYGHEDAAVDNYDGPEYMYLNGKIDTYYSKGGASRLDLTITRVDSNSTDGAATVVRTNATDNKLTLVKGTWTATETATNIYFAKVTPVYEEEEPEEETYTFQVLGTDGPVEGKKYVIYFPETNSTNVKFLGSTVRENNYTNFGRGVDDVEDSMTSLIKAGETWTLESSKIGDDWTVTDIQWTVVQIGEDLCLQSVANPERYLKLYCANDGKSDITSTEYDDQAPADTYFSLNFTHSGNTDNSYYIISNDNTERADELYYYSNKWFAAVPEYADPEVNGTNQLYIAEVVDDSTEEEESGTGNVETTTQVVSYEFTTLDPNILADLKTGDTIDLAIYIQDSDDKDDYTFLSSNNDLHAITAEDIGDSSNPVTIGQTWTASVTDMGTRDKGNFTWQVVVDVNGDMYLKALGTDEERYLRLLRGTSLVNQHDEDGTLKDNHEIKVDCTEGQAACTLHRNNASDYLYYDASTGTWTATTNDIYANAETPPTATIIYFASVKEVTKEVAVPNNYPEAVETGAPSVDTLRFYNFVANGEHVAALAGCKFVIKGTDEGNSSYTYTIISGDNPELHLPSDIPNGTYTITEESAADGYLRDVNPTRSFTITTSDDGRKIFDGSNTIGKFLNHAQNLLHADKVAEVEDYNNRTYQVMLSAESDLRLYEMNPVDVLFVVDQSNSMLFPAGLESTKQTVTIYRNEGLTAAAANGNSTTSEYLNGLADEGKLSKDQVYYIIADPNVTSTVYALWWNGLDWMYQDASYYAKAYHDNAEGYRQDNELAMFPEVSAASEQPTKMVITENGEEKVVEIKTNGGSLSYDLGNRTTLAKDVIATESGTGKTYTIYTAKNGYNRLHYLQDSLAHAIHQLADANDESTVSLIRFTRVTDHEDCIGPLALSPTNVQTLINAVENIETDGGTRQDIALEHTYDHLTGNVTWMDENGAEHTEDAYTKGEAYTFTVLITDGAPVRSGGDILNLGTATDEQPTDDAYEQLKTTEDTKENDASVKLTAEEAAALNEANGITVYSSIKYWGDKVGISQLGDTNGESILMTIGLGMGAVDGGSAVLGEIATGGAAGGNHMIIDDAEQLMNALKQLLFNSMVPREKVDLMANVTDVISDSFYPIAWVPEGQAPSDRDLLTMKDPQDIEKDWIILEPGDWITCEGQYVGPNQTSGDLFGTGQLTKLENGDFQITWDNQMLYDCELVWVPTLAEVPEGRRVVMTEDHVKTEDGTTADETYGRYWFKLAVGDYVYAHGEYVALDDSGNQTKSGTVPYGFVNAGMTYEIAGQYVKKDGADRAHINWNLDLDGDGTVDNSYYDVDFDANFQPYNWHGKFYVKAKEDFIGGNAIDTNKSAKVEAQENDGDNVEESIGTVDLDTPTVNVRLLDMNQNNSEVTVFLGDMINEAAKYAEDGTTITNPLYNPLGSLQDFYNKTKFTKLIEDIAGKGAVMNAPDSVVTEEDGTVEYMDGLETDVFYLRYAMGRDLTEDEWKALVNGDEVVVEYTYDNASSHGPVGYFTFKLTKTGDTANYAAHEATRACKVQHTHDARCTAPVETYTLHVTYTAYKLDETSKDGSSTRPEATVHNDTADIDGDGKTAGTEVGGADAGGTLPAGMGEVDKDNVHKVHVISGAVWVTKDITEELKSDEEQTFTFTLHRTEDIMVDDNGKVVLDENGDPVPDPANDRKLVVVIPPGATSGNKAVTGLKRGTWVLTESPSDIYSVKELSIIMVDDGGKRVTNCYSTADGAEATFHMGFDWQNDQNVISKAVTSKEGAEVTTYADYTSYTGTPNGVYGAANVVNEKKTFPAEVPVEKLWFDGAENHEDESVLLVLYDNGSTVMVDGKAQYLYLNKGNSWKGTFTVYLNGAEDSVAKHNYSVKEAVVTALTQEEYEILQEDVKSSYVPLIMVEGETETIVIAKVVEHEKILADGDKSYFVQYGTKKETIDGKEQTVHTVTNSPARVLPESGGMGTYGYTFSGWLLIAAALMYGCIRRRKREGRAVE